jgi:ferredoxin--NADP+ reductase
MIKFGDRMELAIDQGKASDNIPVELQEVLTEAKDTYTFRFKPGAELTWEAGSNAHLVVPEIKTVSSVDKEWRRHMSVMSTPDEGYMGFTTRIRDPRSMFKTRMMNARRGDRMHVYGIKNHFPLVRQGNPIVLLSMGVGMATMRSLIRSYVQDQDGVPGLTSINVDRERPGVYQAEMDRLRVPGFSSFYLQNRRDFFNRVDRSLHIKDALYYLVGSDEFLSSMAYYLSGSGVPKSNLKIDKKPHKVRAILDAV